MRALPSGVKDEAARELLTLSRDVTIDAVRSLAEWDRDAVLTGCHATTFVAFPAADVRCGADYRAAAGLMEVRPVGAGGHYYFKIAPELVASLVNDAVDEVSETTN